jgi:enamine deaminase RidA (YjgF/YER057c/UK114 family)
MDRQRISSGTPWESIAGYSRALRVGNIVYVAGTTASDETGAVVGENDAHAQATYIFQKIGKALAEAGASLNDVVHTRMYLTNINDWQDIAKVHGQVFETVRPASTLLEVSKLIAPEFLVEIEVEAIIAE